MYSIIDENKDKMILSKIFEVKKNIMKEQKIVSLSGNIDVSHSLHTSNNIYDDNVYNEVDRFYNKMRRIEEEK